jgi:proline dehydrogenase
MTKSTNPKKAFGDNKIPAFSVVSPLFLAAVGVAMRQGAAKYGAYNWRDDPVDVMTYLDAIVRHASLMAMGEDKAADGTWHAAHIAASCAILIDAAAAGALIDNRPALPAERLAAFMLEVDAERAKVDQMVAAARAARRNQQWADAAIADDLISAQEARRIAVRALADGLAKEWRGPQSDDNGA